MNNWQPISTAPKDGTPIMIAKFRDNGELVDVDFDATWSEITDYAEALPQQYFTWCSAWGRIEEPTHWMPMPSTPATSGAGGERNL